MYYAYIENNKINGVGECPQLTEGVINYEISEEIFNNYIEDNLRYIWDDSDVVLNPNYEQEQAQKEQERINNLTMTPLDFIGVLVNLGLSLEQINAFLESNLNIKMQLTYCNSVYCGVVKSFLPMEVGGVTITAEMVEQAFILKNGG